jgi:ABC-2 type transport system ATP-binding protein
MPSSYTTRVEGASGGGSRYPYAVIDVAGLTQRYGTYTAVRELSFRLEAGEVVGFLGPNGAGKSTTLKVLAGYLAPSAGRVRVAGHDVLRDPLAVRRALGYLPEHCPLYDEMLVEAFLGFAAQVRGLRGVEAARAIGRVVERCGLGEVFTRPCGELSKGFRQRVGIAQALLHDPPVLILDEPTSGLDPNQVLEVRGLVRDLGAERTVLFSSHILSEVEATCRRVVVIHQGRLVADDDVDALQRRVRGGAVRVRVAGEVEDLLERLAAVEGVAQATREEGPQAAWRLTPTDRVEDLAERVHRAAVANGWTLSELAPARVSLEDVFAALTGGDRGR